MDNHNGGKDFGASGNGNRVDEFLKELHAPASNAAEVNFTESEKPREPVAPEEDQDVVISRNRAKGAAEPAPKAAAKPAHKIIDGNKKKMKNKDKKGKKEGRAPWWKKLLKVALYMVAAMSVLICAVAVMMAIYLAGNTIDDEENLDLNNLKLRFATRLMAETEPGSGVWEEYQRIYGEDNRVWIDYSEMQEAPELLNALVASEDHRFWEHTGVDVIRTGSALVDTALKAMGLKGLHTTTQGGSTITQQLIKNITGEKEAEGFEGILRKVREIYRAFEMERRFSKEQVLEAYLNTANYGGQIGGIEAAANYYFGVETKDLTAAQSAAILCITKFPTKNNPFTNPDQNRAARDLVLYDMSRYTDANGNIMLTAEEYAAALEESAAMEFTEPYPNRSALTRGGVYSYFTDVAIDEVLADITTQYMDGGLGKATAEAKAKDDFYNGGLTIYLTVDPFVQAVMEDTFKNGPVAYTGSKPNVVELDENGNIKLNTEKQTWDTRRWLRYEVVPQADLVYDAEGNRLDTDKNGNQIFERNGRLERLQKNQYHASGVVMDYEGHLRGIAGDVREKTESLTHGGWAADPEKIRNVGSSMKPLAAYALALEYHLINFSTAIMDSPVRVQGGSGWPKNYSGKGSNQFVTLAAAVAVSLNTTAVRALQMVGAEVTYDFLVNTLDLTTLDPVYDNTDAVCLGSFRHGVSMYAMCAAFTIFGTDGTYHQAHSYYKVEGPRGDVIYNKENNVYANYAVSPQTAWIMNRLMSGVVNGGTGGAAVPTSKDNPNNLPYIGKTGTSTGHLDATFAGMNPYYCCYIWEGMQDWTPLNKAFGWPEPKVTQMLFRTIMSRISYHLSPAQLENNPTKKFIKPDHIVEIAYCKASGLIASGSCPSTGSGTYEVGHEPDAVCPGTCQISFTEEDPDI